MLMEEIVLHEVMEMLLVGDVLAVVVVDAEEMEVGDGEVEVEEGWLCIHWLSDMGRLFVNQQQ